MPELALRSYVDEHGRAPFEAWVLDLDSQAQAKVAIALSRLQAGNMSNVKGIGEGVCELKLDWGPGYRVYFGQDGKTIVILLCGGNEEAAKPGHRDRESPMGELQGAQERATAMNECWR
jgi:putative addiction module killer protein